MSTQVVLNARTQLTLFVASPVAQILEPLRRTLDPVQSRLIPAHVTLCREDDLLDLSADEIGTRLRKTPPGPLTLTFGMAQVFQDHGVLLPCVAGEVEFQALRNTVLGAQGARRHTPHLTLAHPRNPRAPDNKPATLLKVPSSLSVTFSAVSLIHQHVGEPWRVLAEYEISGPRRGAA
jgi:2'-5' RNA ligase